MMRSGPLSVLQVVGPFNCCQFGLFLVLGDYKQSQYEHLPTGSCVSRCFHFSSLENTRGIAGLSSECMFNRIRNC
jgi:hypothetical protein